MTVNGRFLVVRRRPHTLLQNLFAGRGLGDINVPARHLDRDVEDILAAVHDARATHRRRAAD